MDMEILVRPAEESDLDQLAQLVAELSAFYGATIEVNDDLRNTVRSVLFDDNQGTHVLVANNESGLVGMASYNFTWPGSGGNRAVYLKELYVTERCRSQGIGTQLIDAVKAAGRAHQCVRIDWTVDNFNDQALGFYSRIGGFTSDKIGYRLLL